MLRNQRLRQAGWSGRTIFSLLHCHTKTVRKWWRRFQESQQYPTQMQPSLWWEDLSPPSPVTNGDAFTCEIPAQLLNEVNRRVWNDDLRGNLLQCGKLRL
ncbi:MAG: hypothetical protein J2P21_25245 [Chloracidobacterium sp.]|nr:hypothetical protein [Chloracidobacterium sp.]